jgi:26S proteasome regulatory subunit N10
VNIDVINFANPDNVPKLEAFVATANKDEGSHFMNVPMGINMITDVLITSPICMPEEMGGGAPAMQAQGGVPAVGGSSGADRFAEFGGVDPSLEPELAMALKVSLEEERDRL